MKKSYCFLYGIDVSKDLLDICFIQDGQKQYYQISNCKVSILKWLNRIDKSQSYIVVEYTGCYSSQLLDLLSSHGVAVSAVNPSQSSHFIKALGIINKNDKNASEALALLGQSLDLPLYVMKKQTVEQRKQLVSSLVALKKQRQMLKNQLHALSYQPRVHAAVELALATTLQTVEQQIEMLQKELEDLSDEEEDQEVKRMMSVVGIGAKTAQALLNATGGLHHFEHDRQLAKFIGLVPTSHHSGSSVCYKGPITKKGNAHLRACLYMAARSAKRFNLACKELYERLRSKGKSHKKAMVAVMHKLIRQVFAVVKNDRDFDNQYYLRFV